MSLTSLRNFMRIFTNYNIADERDRNASIAIGNFDGVHLGHQSIIKLAKNMNPDSQLGVLTFDPHPREFFRPADTNFRLMNTQTKNNRLKKLGIKLLYQLAFNQKLASLTAREFAEKVISKGLGAKNVVVGADFCFGKERAGTVKILSDLGSELGFTVGIADIVTGNGEILSSTNIRKLLSNGNTRESAKMLGHWHRIDGKVILGDQRGRELGYPTANISLEGLHMPKLGVYAVLVDILSGPHRGSYKGAAAIGCKPTFGENVINCETYIFDFHGDIYGESISVGLVDFLRPEEAFKTVDELVIQMKLDCEKAYLKLNKL